MDNKQFENGSDEILSKQTPFSPPSPPVSQPKTMTLPRVSKTESPEKTKNLAPDIKGHIFQNTGEEFYEPENENEMDEIRKKNTSRRLIPRIFTTAILSFIIIFLIYFFFFRVRTIQLILDNTESEIKIPLTVETAKLIKSSTAYTLKKQETLEDKRYYVSYTEDYSLSSVPSPKDACSRVLFIVPADDASAMRGAKNFKEGQREIKTEEEKKQAEQMMTDVNHLNEVQKSAYLLPADAFIRDDSRKIQKGDIIIVSGMNFKITNPENPVDPEKEIFLYVTKLEIK